MYGYLIADVFTDTALEGNPLAVVPDASGLSTERMQRIAREMNLSETTFVFPPSGDGDVHVRIFTPVGELPFAGHPTFGTAAALAATAHPAVHNARLHMETGMGVIPFHFSTISPTTASARMEQPLPVWHAYDRAADLLAALGLSSSTVPIEVYRNGPRHAFVGLPTVADLSALRVDHRALSDHPDLAANCFAPTPDPSVWRARMFSPAYGVNEDAGTGSAAGPLALHLTRHGLIPPNTPITVRQGIEMGRPSTIHARATMRDATTPARIEITGSAVLVAEGRLHI